MHKATISLLAASLSLALAAGALAGGAWAGDRIVHQRGRAFSINTMTVNRGDAVTFANDDSVPHNIMSTSAPNAFDLGSQQPGTAIPVSFTESGTFDVICAIHPRMHMTITVLN